VVKNHARSRGKAENYKGATSTDRKATKQIVTAILKI
jgi:hypothetical protein